jgi:hypothetical protein
MIARVLLVGGIVPWLLLGPYRRGPRERSSAPRRNRGSLGYVPDLIDRERDR